MSVCIYWQVPPELEGRKGDLPMLCMEYCSGGDLRKVRTYCMQINHNCNISHHSYIFNYTSYKLFTAL